MRARGDSEAVKLCDELKTPSGNEDRRREGKGENGSEGLSILEQG